MTAPAWRQHGIRRRVTLLVVAGAVAPMALFAWIGWPRVETLSRRLLAERQILADSLARHADHILQEGFAVLASAGAGESDPAAALRSALLHSKHFVAVALVTADGQVLFEDSRRPPPPGPVLSRLSQVPAVADSGRQVVATLGLGQAVLLVPLRDWEGRIDQVACGVIEVGGPGWAPVLRAESLGSGSADIVDGEGRILASSDPSRVGRAASAAEDEVVVSTSLAASPWRLILRQPESEALGPVRTLRRTLLLAGPLLVLVALLFAWGAARSVTEPLASLSRAADRLASGHLGTPVSSWGGDEVGHLAASFETMRQALQRSLADLTRANEELEERVRDRTEKLTRLLDKLVSAQEEERKRLARELHDETCQTMAALGMKLDVAMAAPPEGVRDRVSEARSFARRALDEIHRLIYDLRPSVLDDLGLVAAIRWLAERHASSLGIAVRCETDELPGRLSPQVETTLFRAAQEALQNVARHSRAETVLVQVAPREGALEVEIEDDGVGFDPALVASPEPTGRGLGLLGMRERLALVGGTAQIESSPGGGTRVVLRVPYGQDSRSDR